MKERFTKEPVLAAPDIDKKMRMEVDALDYATGGVLLMECGDGLWRPVAFLSKSLNETERNYEIHDGVLYESTEVEQKTGQMGLIFVSV